MKGMYRLAMIATISCLTAVSAQNAEAFRFRRTCCCQSRQCFGPNYVCLEMELYQIGDDDYLYYAYSLKGGCDATPESEPYEDVYYDGLPQDCPSGHCLPGDPTSLEKSNGCPKKWAGLKNPVDPNYMPPFSSCATHIDCHFECLRICDQNNHWKCYKVKVFDVCLPKTRCPLHVAYEVTGFPQGVNPCPICIGKSNCSCPKCFVYSLCYCGKKLLLLTAD